MGKHARIRLPGPATDAGPAIAFASSDRAYAEQVVTAVRRAMDALEERAQNPSSEGP